MTLIERIKNSIYIRAAACIRYIRCPQKYRSLGFMLDYLQKEGETFTVTPALSSRLRKRIVSHICTIDSHYSSFYFPKGCVCLVTDEDNADKAIAKGALVLISSVPFREYPCIVSDCPLGIYSSLIRYYRFIHNKTSFTAVTGSIGKTTVKNMIGEVYRQAFVTSYTQANANTRVHIGFAIQHIPYKAQMVVQEVHEGNPGEAKFVARMMCPDVLVITPVDKSHLSRFDSEDGIVNEIRSMVMTMPATGTVIAGLEEIDKMGLLHSGRKCISISSDNPDADYSADSIQVNSDGLSFDIVDKKAAMRYHIQLNHLYGLHNASCALYAFAAGMSARMSPSDIIVGLAGYRTSGVRQNVVMTNDGVLLYADCYNAIARSMKSAIETASCLSVQGRRIAVLGDIEEAGKSSSSQHNEVIGYVNHSNFQILFTIGEKIKKALIETPTRESLSVSHFDSLTNLTLAIRETVNPGDLVLFKASHASDLSECIQRIWPAEYSQMNAPLTRDNVKWERELLFY